MYRGKGEEKNGRERKGEESSGLDDDGAELLSILDYSIMPQGA